MSQPLATSEYATIECLTQAICRFASRLNLPEIPEDVHEKATLHILDAVGCALAGADTDLAETVYRFLCIEHLSGPVPVLGTALSFGPAAAAFANSTAMNALDFDDGVEVDGVGMGHPGATIIAAALSATFVRLISGTAFLTAVVAAYEINNRFIQAMQPSMPRFREIYGVCQHQALGAAIAYGLLTGLEEEDLENVVGLACTLANVPSLRKYNFGARPLISFKDFNATAAEAGVRAVQMHQCGIVGSKAVLDGPTGFWRMLGSDRFDPVLMTVELGSRWAMLDSTIKPYPACRWMHCAMDAFEGLIRQHALTADEIDEVIVHTSAGLARDFMESAPQTMVDAQFSFPYAFAALAFGLATARAWYLPESLRDPRLLAFARRVRADIDPEIDRLMGNERKPAGRVTLRCGERIFASDLISHAPGSRERPLSQERIVEKFMANAAPALGEAAAREMSGRILALASVPDVAGIFRTA